MQDLVKAKNFIPIIRKTFSLQAIPEQYEKKRLQIKKNNFATMQKVKSHTKNLKHLLWVWLAFFSLTPCVAKEALFSTVNTEYIQPLNKSKTTASTNSCQYSQSDIQKTSVAKKSNTAKHTETEKLTVHVLFVIRSIGLNTNYSKTTSGNSPPKYILYKRLKVDVA